MKLKLGNHYLYTGGGYFREDTYEFATKVVLLDIVKDNTETIYLVADKSGEEFETLEESLTEI